MTEGPDLPLPSAKSSDQIRPDEKCKACEPPVRFNGVPVDVLPAATGIERLTYNVPGLIGDLIEWNLATARSPSRIMALAAAIAVVGKLLDRKVAGPTKSATHLYIVVLAPTGAGKGHQIDVTKRALMAAGMRTVIGPDDFSSVQALQSLIIKDPSWLCVMDEFGSFLRRIKDGPYGNVSEITGEMRKLWEPWRPYNSIKKAKEESVTVEAPALSILALATPVDFYSALVVQDLSNGFLN